jgi:hypothetical protein
MARAAILLALCSVMLFAGAAQASGRDLLQALDCSRIPNW